jgi:propanol-preferring alcohol dehydrogenase
VLNLVRRTLPEPAPGQVRLRVEACGVCHSGSATVEGQFPGLLLPRVPGHEVVGRIDALGSGVQGWAVGQRVGVGFLGGPCGHCEFCRGGGLVNCRNQEHTGIHGDGGYAEVMTARASGLVAIPDELSSAAAAPLLGAGITTFSALRNSKALPGEAHPPQLVACRVRLDRGELEQFNGPERTAASRLLLSQDLPPR